MTIQNPPPSLESDAKKHFSKVSPSGPFVCKIQEKSVCCVHTPTEAIVCEDGCGHVMAWLFSGGGLLAMAEVHGCTRV